MGAPRRRLSPPPLWLAYPCVAGVVAALYLLGPLNSGPVFNVLGASSAVAVAVGAARHRPRGRAAWHLVAVGQALFVVGDVLAYNHERLFGTELPYPSIADPLYLAMYPCLAAAMGMLLRERGRARDHGGLIDALVVAIGCGTLSWAYLMAPYAHDSTLTLLEQVTSLAYPVMDLMLLAVAVRLLLGGAARSVSSHLLAVGLLALLATDGFYGWVSISGGYDTGGLLDVGWMAFYVLTASAALHPSMRTLSDRAPHAPAGLTRRRLTLLAITSLLAPGVQLTRALLDQPREPVITVASGVLFLLVLARLTGLVRVQEQLTADQLRRRFETRLAALVRHASDVVSILDADGRHSYLSPSAMHLFGRSPEELTGCAITDLVHPDDVTQVRGFVGGLREGDSGSARYRVRHADGSWRDVDSLATNLTGDADVGGIVLNTRDVSERTALERRLEHQAFHDALTGLPNRALFQDRVQQALSRLRRERRGLAVLFLDLDDFKHINDSLGHAAGDGVLCEVAVRLGVATRPSDSAARLGGDEFAVLMDGLDDERHAISLAERLMATVGRPMEIGGAEVMATPSIGIAFAAAGVTSADELLRNADTAMYLAKDQGKGRYAIFQPAMHAAALERLQLKGDLQRAVREDGLSLVYQPVVELKTGDIVGVEALARWMHPARGAVSPGEFIPLAEESGLIVPLGRALLRRACAQAAALQAASPRALPLSMAVNLSARQLLSPDLTDDVAAALQESGIPPSSLVLELTESAVIEDFELATERLAQLRSLGVSLAIDDFGTGYSSLTYIRRFPADVLKIDRSFIQDAGSGSADAERLTASILDLAASLSLTPVAEGIEDELQLARLRELGCPLGQGFHLYRPMAGAEVEALVGAQTASGLPAA